MRPFPAATAAGNNVVNTSGSLVVAYGLAGAEKIAVMIYNGATYQPYVDASGTAYELTATKTNLPLPGVPVTLRFDKTATAASAGIAIY